MGGMRGEPYWMRWALAISVMVVMVANMEMEQVGGEEYTVGGAAGMWDIPSLSNINYSMWALWNTYFVGDSLLFRYRNGEHSVLEVMFKDYESCRNVRPIAMYEGGNTRVLLDKYGPYYFICGTPEHCYLGQKFKIDVSDYQRAYSPPLPISPSSHLPTMTPSPGPYAPSYSLPRGVPSHSYSLLVVLFTLPFLTSF